MGMRALVISEKKQQFDQGFVVGDEPAVVDHGKDLLLACPFRSLHFLILEVQLREVQIPDQDVVVIESAAEGDAGSRDGILQVCDHAQLFLQFPFRTCLAGFAAGNGTAYGQVPHVAPVIFEGLTLLDQQLPLGVEDRDMYHQTIAVGWRGGPTEHRFAGGTSLRVIKIECFHDAPHIVQGGTSPPWIDISLYVFFRRRS